MKVTGKIIAKDVDDNAEHRQKQLVKEDQSNYSGNNNNNERKGDEEEQEQE